MTLENIPGLRQYASVIARYLKLKSSAKTTHHFYDRLEIFISWAEEVERNENRPVLYLPIDAADLVQYARALYERGLSYATIRSYVSAIGTMHKIVEMYNPTADLRVKAVLAELGEKYPNKHADNLPHTHTFSDNDITNILDNLHHPRKFKRGMETLKVAQQRAAVDKALLFTMVQAGMHRSETANLAWGDVREQPDGSGRLLLPRKRGSNRKTSIAITASCLHALWDIKPEKSDDNSRVFNISDTQVNRRIKTMCANAGIDPANVSSHTPRATLHKFMMGKGVPAIIFQRHYRANLHPSIQRLIINPEDDGFVEWLEEIEV